MARTYQQARRTNSGKDRAEEAIVTGFSELRRGVSRSEWDAALLAERATAQEREKHQLHAQMFEAAQIQRKLSGPRVLRLGELECAREVFSAEHLSGDFAVFWQKDRKLIAAIGDIAGKGLAAGMWFTHLIGLVQRYATTEATPRCVIEEINRHLCFLRPLAPFVTLFLAEIDVATGAVEYCNAGHFPPVLLQSQGERVMLETGGPLMGALADARYEAGQQELDSGDCLLAYSDGIIECRNRTDEEFGVERLTQHAWTLTGVAPQAAIVELLGAVQDFAGGGPISDDMSLMLVHRGLPGDGDQWAA